MKNPAALVILILICLMCKNASAQKENVITGKLWDERTAPVSYANVMLVKVSDSALVTGTLTDTNGNFIIKSPAPGIYFLRISAIGFAEIKTPPFDITETTRGKNFGSIILKDDVKKLKEVTISALRPTITHKPDRMVVSVEGTAMAAGSTAFDVLSKAPGVFIDHEGNIQLNGQAGVTVMIDEKLTYLSGRDLRVFLEGMSAENIKNIEIITQPSSKYDAEGSAGILNINLKKNEQQGVKSSVYTSYTFNGKQHGYSTGGNIYYKSGKWNSFASLDWSRRAGGRDATFTRVFFSPQQTTYFDQVADGNFISKGPSARLGTDFSINKNHSIGLMANYTGNNNNGNFLTETFIGNEPNKPGEFIDADNVSSGRYSNFTTNLHYLGKLDTSGTALSADLDYADVSHFGKMNSYNYFYKAQDMQLVTKDFLFSDVPSRFDIYAAKIDFTKPLKNDYKVETGAKVSRVDVDNASVFYLNNGDAPILDTLRTNHFKYRENIYAAYVNVSGKLSRRVTVQAGLRAEQTQSLGNSLTTKQVTERNYLDFFPTLFIQQHVSDNYQVKYNYSRRLERPYYGDLNPFISYRDPYTWWQGNPYLRPEYINTVSIGQTFKQTYNVEVEYQYNRDVVSELPILDAERTTTVYYVGNVNNAHFASLTALAPLKIMKNWETQNTLVVSYNRFNIKEKGVLMVNDRAHYMLQSNHTLVLPLDIRMELNVGYISAMAHGLYRIEPRWWFHTAFKKSFLDKKLDLSLNVNDIFKGQRLKLNGSGGENIHEFDQYFRNRYFGITLRYNFSKGQKVDERRRNNFEELNRTGG